MRHSFHISSVIVNLMVLAFISPALAKSPFHQCFKSKARDVYCSSKQFKSHAEGASWVTAALQHFNLKGSDISGKPYEVDTIPKDATTF